MEKYKEDLDYVRSLVDGGIDAWEKFYSKNREKIGKFLFFKYPEFGRVEVEEICDNVQNRLTKNNYKVLRQYRGECTFDSFVKTATNWAVQDWFKANSIKLFQVPFDEHINSQIEPRSSVPYYGEPLEIIKSLPDDLRQAFLLRYYDDFGFPLKEITLLAQRTGRRILKITELMAKCFSPEGENLLTRRREKKFALEVRLQKCSSNINTLRQFEEKFYKKISSCLDTKAQNDIKNKLKNLEAKKNHLEKKREVIRKQISSPTKTPYEIIAEIMNIDNVSTIRSWVRKAKGILQNSLEKKTGSL